VAAAVLVRTGPVFQRAFLDERRVEPIPLDLPPEAVVELLLAGPDRELPDAVRRSFGAGPWACADPGLGRRLALGGTAVTVPSLSARRAARQLVHWPPKGLARAFALTLARRRVERALESDEEAVIALAREEERVERALGREGGAAEQFLAGPTGPLAEYAEEWTEHRETLRRHHERLLGRLEELARRISPSLSALVGPRVAARLIAAAGDRAALARMTGARLQILGARRRPGEGRGPRYGILYRAARMTEIPPELQGRYARSLAALAVIAARADALTRRDLGPTLVARRDRRIERLRRVP
jgi:hypothetical protein